jgi:hypothetical protein
MDRAFTGNSSFNDVAYARNPFVIPRDGRVVCA